LLKFLDSGLGNSGAVEAPGTQGADAALVLPRFVPLPPRFGDDPDACSTCFCRRFTGESSFGREINPYPFGLIFDITYS
jgi:hypothetical protein